MVEVCFKCGNTGAPYVYVPAGLNDFGKGITLHFKCEDKLIKQGKIRI